MMRYTGTTTATDRDFLLLLNNWVERKSSYGGNMYNRLIHCIPLTFPCMDYLNLRKWVFITLVNFIRNWEAIGYFDYGELNDFFKEHQQSRLFIKACPIT